MRPRIFITKETRRQDVLPGSIKSNWDNPDELYGIIIGALNDGFYPDVIYGGANFDYCPYEFQTKEMLMD